MSNSECASIFYTIDLYKLHLLQSGSLSTLSLLHILKFDKNPVDISNFIMHYCLLRNANPFIISLKDIILCFIDEPEGMALKFA